MGDMCVSERWRRSRRSNPRSRYRWLLLLLRWRRWRRRQHNAIALTIHRLRARAGRKSSRSCTRYTGSSRRRHRSLTLHRVRSQQKLWRRGLLLGRGLLLRRRWRRDHAPWQSTRTYGRTVWCAPALLRSAWWQWRWRWRLRLRLDGFAV